MTAKTEAEIVATGQFEETDDPDRYIYRGPMISVAPSDGSQVWVRDGDLLVVIEDEGGWHEIVQVIPAKLH